MISRRTIIKFMSILPGAISTAGIPMKKDGESDHIAKYWMNNGNAVQCQLCPHECSLKIGQIGICRCRKNDNGKLITYSYANPCAVNVDPIEKKPLFHVLPGSKTYSIGIAGCNLRCKNCQNYTMSQKSPLETENIFLPPQDAVANAIENKCKSIAYTYSEPVVWIEYVQETATLAKKAGLKNVLVSSGYVNSQPLKELCAVIDCAHIDLKSFDDIIYRNLNGGKLAPVLKTLEIAKQMGVWIEIVNLVIPSWNDNFQMIQKMSSWIRETLGKETPIHFSRFFPMFKLEHLYPTPTETLEKARRIALDEGLFFAYVGNVPDIPSHTLCPYCKTLLIERHGYRVKNHIMDKGVCFSCKKQLPGIW